METSALQIPQKTREFQNHHFDSTVWNDIKFRDNDIVIIAPWDFKAEERGDILWRFTLPQVDWLKQNDHIPKDF